jgi:hypothetical protein
MSYCIKTIKFVVNMELCRDVLLQQVIRQIGDIQNIDSFECTWKKFDTCAIWSQAMNTHSLSITFSILTYNVNGMSLYNLSLLIIEKYPHHISLFHSLGNISHVPLHSPKSQWRGCPFCKLVELSLLQLDYFTYFAL